MRSPPGSFVVSLVAVLLTACAPAAEAPAPTPRALPVPAGAQQATVVRPVDGDTVLLRGRGVGPLPAMPTRVRILLIDTPEVHSRQECFGQQASQRAGELLPEGSTVRVEADRDPEDRFGRSLLHVWNAEGVNVGAALVREGFAEVLFLRPNDRYLDQFEQAEQEARAAERGLWTACPP